MISLFSKKRLRSVCWYNIQEKELRSSRYNLAVSIHKKEIIKRISIINAKLVETFLAMVYLLVAYKWAYFHLHILISFLVQCYLTVIDIVVMQNLALSSFT